MSNGDGQLQKVSAGQLGGVEGAADGGDIDEDSWNSGLVQQQQLGGDLQQRDGQLEAVGHQEVCLAALVGRATEPSSRYSFVCSVASALASHMLSTLYPNRRPGDTVFMGDSGANHDSRGLFGRIRVPSA